jgi:hypothetical protein
MPEEAGEWGGKIQRVVDGEAYEFDSWTALVDTLRAMLTATSPPATNSTQDKDQPGPSEC